MEFYFVVHNAVVMESSMKCKASTTSIRGLVARNLP